MKINEQELQKVLKMALAPNWDDGVPTIPAKLRLAVNSVMDQTRKDLPRDPNELLKLIQKKNNRGIRRILSCRKVTVEALAFTIRTALS